MATYSTSLKLTLIGDGEQTGTWGSTTNTNFGSLLEQAIVGQTTITMVNADYTLTNLNGTLDEARSAVIIVGGNQNATYSVIVPAVPKLYMVTNSLNSSAVAYIKMSGGTTTQVPNGQTMYLYCTGVAGASWGVLNYVQNAQNLVTGGTITTGAINCTSLTSSGAIIGTTGTFSGAIIGTTINGTTITAGTQFTGPGTGLTGTAASLNIGGTALNITASSNTSLTSLSNLVTVGTITSGTWSGSFGAVSGANLTNITGANVTGTVANATTAVNSTNATTAVTVSTTVASGAVGTTQTTGDSSTKIATTQFVQTALQLLYPVGAIYSSTSATNPGTAFGFGTWVAFGAGRVMIGNGGGFSAGATGGSADATLVSHNHGGVTGGQNQNHVHTVAGTTGFENQGHVHTNSQGEYGVLNSTATAGGGGVEEGAGAPNIFYDSMGNPNVQHTHTFSTTSAANNVDHTHSIATDGSSATNANLQPYVVVYMWNRTA